MHRLLSAARLFVVIAAALAFAPVARADGFTVTVTQVGSNVVVTGSGAINVAGLSKNLLGGCQINSGIIPVEGLINVGSGNCDEYEGISGPFDFGPGFSTHASSNSGDAVGIIAQASWPPAINVPLGYISGDFLSDTSTYNNVTISGIGATPGTYIWTWGNGEANQKFTLNIVAPVPEPSSTLLLGSGAIVLIGFGRRKLRA